MRTRLNQSIADDATIHRADEILRSCVHCGFCNAVCPTYALTGNELDGPRGRIYLVKGLLEGQESTTLTRSHLDRCLNCRACESACPSGVDYHVLADIGRELVLTQAPASRAQRFLRWAIGWLFGHPRRAAAVVWPLKLLRPVLWPSLRRRIPRWRDSAGKRVDRMQGGADAWVLLDGCVQSAFTPSTNAAALNVFDHAGLPIRRCGETNCCGALPFHLGKHREARKQVADNIARWDQDLSKGAPGIVSTASGCAAFIEQYPEVVRSTPDLIPAARRVADAVKDPSEVLLGAKRWINKTAPLPDLKVALHQPCSLRHGSGRSAAVTTLLEALGVEAHVAESGSPCCGSAGAYSLLHPLIGRDLRQATLGALKAHGECDIATSNIGCRLHLQAGTSARVQHWLEYVSEALPEDQP